MSSRSKESDLILVIVALGFLISHVFLRWVYQLLTRPIAGNVVNDTYLLVLLFQEVVIPVGMLVAYVIAKFAALENRAVIDNRNKRHYRIIVSLFVASWLVVVYSRLANYIEVASNNSSTAIPALPDTIIETSLLISMLALIGLAWLVFETFLNAHPLTKRNSSSNEPEEPS